MRLPPANVGVPCPTLKVLLRLLLRQVIGLVESLLTLADLDWPVPDFSTLCRPLPGSACLHAREGSEEPDGRDPVSRLQGAAAAADPLSGIAAQYPAWQYTVPASRPRAMGSGTRAGTGHPSPVSGARYTWESTQIRWKSGTLKLPAIT